MHLLLILGLVTSVLSAGQDNSVLLQYASSGIVRTNNIPVKWSEDFEHPNSTLFQTYQWRLDSMVIIALYGTNVTVQDTSVVFWPNKDIVWADITFNFATDTWRNVKGWDQDVYNKLLNSDQTYYLQKYRSTYPIYANSVTKPEYIEGWKDTPYKTSFKVTLVFNCKPDGWSDNWTTENSPEQISACTKVQHDLTTLFENPKFIQDSNPKCLFWMEDGEVKVAATLHIAYDVTYNTSIFENVNELQKLIENRLNQNIGKMEILKNYGTTSPIHTTPVQYPGNYARPEGSTTIAGSEDNTGGDGNTGSDSIILEYQTLGYLILNGNNLSWTTEFTNPISPTSQNYKRIIGEQIRADLSTIPITPEDMSMVFWDSNGIVSVNVVFYFKESSWPNITYWNTKIRQTLNKGLKSPYYHTQGLITPAYSSSVKKPYFILTDEPSKYETSYAVTYVFTCGNQGWSNALMINGDPAQIEKCSQVFSDIHKMYGKKPDENFNRGCLFWLFNGQIFVSAHVHIPFYSANKLVIFDDYNAFYEEAVANFKGISESFGTLKRFVNAMPIHTNPVLFSDISTTTTTTATTTESTTMKPTTTEATTTVPTTTERSTTVPTTTERSTTIPTTTETSTTIPTTTESTTMESTTTEEITTVTTTTESYTNESTSTEENTTGSMTEPTGAPGETTPMSNTTNGRPPFNLSHHDAFLLRVNALARANVRVRMPVF